MRFGVFDHMDRGPVPLGEFYESRLRLVEAYDRLGFHAYHVAEHHATPLGHAPSPSIFSPPSRSARAVCASARWFTYCRSITRCV